MKDYQQKKLKEYVLPQPVYRQALWAVKDLERLKKRLKELKADAYVLGAHDLTMPVYGYGTGRVCDSTGTKAVDIANLTRRIDSIEMAFLFVPEKYRRGLAEKLIWNVPYDEDQANINTWKKWQQVLLFHVAHNLQIF